MEIRRWLPYHTVQTRHLGLLLGTARLIAWLGFIWIAFGIAVAATGYLIPRLMGVVLAGYGLGFLAFSGLLAALVGIEESLRRRAERD